MLGLDPVSGAPVSSLPGSGSPAVYMDGTVTMTFTASGDLTRTQFLAGQSDTVFTVTGNLTVVSVATETHSRGGKKKRANAEFLVRKPEPATLNPPPVAVQQLAQPTVTAVEVIRHAAENINAGIHVAHQRAEIVAANDDEEAITAILAVI